MDKNDSELVGFILRFVCFIESEIDILKIKSAYAERSRIADNMKHHLSKRTDNDEISKFISKVINDE